MHFKKCGYIFCLFNFFGLLNIARVGNTANGGVDRGCQILCFFFVGKTCRPANNTSPAIRSFVSPNENPMLSEQIQRVKMRLSGYFWRRQSAKNVVHASKSVTLPPKFFSLRVFLLYNG